jgi:adenosine deaminase
VVADAAVDNIKYMELRFNPVALAFHQGFGFEEVSDWVIAAVNKAQQDYDIRVQLIVQMGRHEPQFARRLAELAVARREQGIIALDLAGDEEHFSAEKFIEVMHWARDQGMHIIAHAGECRNCPASNVYEAVEVIGAERIGHGVHAINDERVVELLKQKQITLEMCPTSNLQTGSIFSLVRHPLRYYHSLGIPVTINTDDPSISNITLTDEYLVACEGIGIHFSDLKVMILNAARATFLPDDERKKLIADFERDLAEFTVEDS